MSTVALDLAGWMQVAPGWWLAPDRDCWDPDPAVTTDEALRLIGMGY